MSILESAAFVLVAVVASLILSSLVKNLVDDVKREAGEWVMPHASRVACLIAIPPWTIGTRHRTLLLESKNVVDAVS